MIFTIMSYNVERGFHNIDHKFEMHRLRAAQRAIRQVNPDILALTESCYGSSNSHNSHTRYFYHFGFRYGLFAGYQNFGPMGGDEGGNFLLSHYPMLGEVVKLPYKSAARGKILIGNKMLTLDVVHPSHSVSDSEKISTLEELIKTREDPYILTGDFNTVHPEDVYDWQKIAVELKQDLGGAKAEKLLKVWKDPKLIPWLLGLGLRDAFPKEERKSTVPSYRVNQAEREGVRMDFFFVSQSIKVKHAYVLKNKDTEIASDHYPIVGEFEI